MTRIVNVWKNVTPQLRDELVAFWMEHKALVDPQKAAARAAQAVCIARDADGRLGAVATGELRVPPRLRQPIYYYRHFVAPALRGQRLTREFGIAAIEILRQYNAGLAAPEALGVLVEVENTQLDAAYQLAHHPDAGYTFIGYSPRGFKLFVSYFAGAKLGPPRPLPRRA
jgi:hypothetical protein